MEIFNLILDAITELGIEYPTPLYKKEIVEYIKTKKPDVLSDEVDDAFKLYWLCDNY